MENRTAAGLLKFAGITALGLMLFFLLMKFLNLIANVELRFVNFFIILIGIRQLLVTRKKENDGKLEYLPGMMMGFTMALMASVIFALFVFLYLSFIDLSLMENIRNTQSFGSFLSPGTSALIIILEGGASGAILSFALMHLYNKDNIRG